MADNYLENRMEEYRSGRLASRSRTTPSMRAPKHDNALVLRYPPMCIAVISDSPTTLAEAVVRAFTSVGCKVAFSANDIKWGNQLAQRSGARFYPATVSTEDMIADTVSRWDKIDRIITLAQVVTDSYPCPVINATCYASSSIDPTVLARYILFLSHPDNTPLLTMIP